MSLVPEILARPHNNYFLTQMKDPVHAAGCVRPLLDPRLAAKIDWPRMILQPGSYIDEKLRGSESDLLFSVPISGRTALLHILVEHQSTPDALMPLRLLGYMTAIWRTYAAENPGKPLPAILPVVVAQCEGPWPVAKDFSSLLDIPPDIADFLRPMQPLFEYRLLDLAALLPAEIQGTGIGRAVLQVMQASRAGNLDAMLLALRALAQAAGKEGDPAFRLSATITYVLATSPSPVQDVFERMQKLRFPQEIIKDTMSAAELLIQEGRQEGRLLALQTAIIEALAIRFDRVPAGLREAVSEIADEPKLRLLHKAAIQAASVEEFSRAL